MPLTWDISACDDYKSLQTDDEWGITEVLIFATMHVGIGRLTEANADEFYARIRLLEQINGNFILASKDGKRFDRPLMPLDIKKRIGLKTNAAWKDETRASFIKRHVTEGTMRDLKRVYANAVRDGFEGDRYQFVMPESEPDAVAAG